MADDGEECQDKEASAACSSPIQHVDSHAKQVAVEGPDAESSFVNLGSRFLPLELFPAADELPPRPPPANENNFAHYYAVDVGKEFHDQYVFKHVNGLCVVGLAPSHAALNADVNITAVDFNVGKSTSRADMKVAGKRKKNAPLLEGNSLLCKIMAGDKFFSVRCCVRGILLEVNHRLIEDPRLLLSHRDTEGHVAILMPRPEDWAKAEKFLLTPEQYRARRPVS